jgi:hypothetical protein
MIMTSYGRIGQYLLRTAPSRGCGRPLDIDSVSRPRAQVWVFSRSEQPGDQDKIPVGRTSELVRLPVIL